MCNDIREFQIRTPERALAVIRGSLRDAVIEIHRSLSMVNAVVSAVLSEGQSQPTLTGYQDGRRNLSSRTKMGGRSAQ
jgi:hypothetical protein